MAETRTPLRRLVDSVRGVIDGLAITFTYNFLRKPVTVEYPDRIKRPIPDVLPERYRGFLEVDLDVCTACKACERDCPIACIKIDMDKAEGQRVISRFDIDLGKCMYCGLCVEACPTECQAPGDAETTRAIRFSSEFEGVTPDLAALCFRFVRPGDLVVPAKVKKGEIAPTRRRGELARLARKKAREYNPVAVAAVLDARHAAEDALVTPAALAARAAEIAAALAAAPLPEALRGLLPRTDCGECGWPTCQAYATALASGEDGEPRACRPGGLAVARDLILARELAAGAADDAAATTAARELVSLRLGRG